MRSLRRRVHFAHFSPRSSRRKYSAVELSAVSSRDIFVDALYFPSIHRIAVVQYSLQIRSPSHTRESIRVACFLSHAKQIYALAVLRKLLCFPFPRKFFWKFASDTGASNRGQQFSGEIKKKKRKRTNSLSVCERSGSRGPLFLDRSPLCLFIYPRTSRGDITTLLRSSRSIPRPLTIFISSHTAFLRSSPGSSYLLPSRFSSPFPFSNFTFVSEFFHSSRAVAVASGTCEENWYCCRERKRFASLDMQDFIAFATRRVRRSLCVNSKINRIISFAWVIESTKTAFSKSRDYRNRVNFIDSRDCGAGNRLRILLPLPKAYDSQKLTLYWRRRFWWCML